jgi:hypothetical protein
MGWIPRRRGALAGFIILVLGVWGGLVPFVGPSFDYSLGSDQTWHWATNRLWLEVLPAAAAILGGLLLITSRTRATALVGGLLGLAAGTWFVVGPTFSTLWEHGNLGTGSALGSTGTRFLEWIGYFYGTGALITLFSAYILGFLAALPRTDEAVAPASPAYQEGGKARSRRFPRRRRTATTAPPA